MHHGNSNYNMNSTSTTDVYSIGDTYRYCEQLFKVIKVPAIVTLSGDLGSGKTTICKEIAKRFGHHQINSSSYQTVSFYSGVTNLIHCDFFRADLNERFFDEEINPLLVGDWIILAEWCDSMPMNPHVQNITIRIIHSDGSAKRTIITKIIS